MMSRACEAVGPHGERCAKPMDHPGKHVPLTPGASAVVRPVVPPTMPAATPRPPAPLVPPSGPMFATAMGGASLAGAGAVLQVPALTLRPPVALKRPGEAKPKVPRIGRRKRPVGPTWAEPPRRIWTVREAAVVVAVASTIIAFGWVLPFAPARPGAGSGAGASSAPRIAFAPVDVHGSGASTTSAFPLAGDVVVRWSATPQSAAGCYHAASLERADGGRLVQLLVNEAIQGTATHTGSTVVQGLPSASYMVAASSECAWSFSFAQR